MTAGEGPESGPVTVCARALVLDEGAVLLVRNHDPEAGEWYVMPGGKLHRGERLDEAARREVLEETGLHVRVGPLWCVWEYLPERNPMPHGRPDQQVHFVFHATRDEFAAAGAGPPGRPARPDTHQAAAEWVPLRDLGGARLYPSGLAAPLRSLESAAGPAGRRGPGGGPEAGIGPQVYLGDMC